MRNIVSIFARLLRAACAFAMLTATGQSLGAGGGLALLLPDNLPTTDPRVMAWTEAAREEGLKLELLSDSLFLQYGAGKYKGIILPDQVHTRASDALIDAVRDYVAGGGKLMLVYDAGSLTTEGVYPAPKSRLSALAGVDYALYSELGTQTIGLGPVVGKESVLWTLQVPPGKSMPFSSVSSTPYYLPASTTNQNGLQFYDHNSQIAKKTKVANNGVKLPLAAVPGTLVPHCNCAPSTDYYLEKKKIKSNKSALSTTALPVAVSPSDGVYGISGYVYGFLNYPSYVTRGSFAGSVLLSSPSFGLAAGINDYGNGNVLFVNLPLSYLKGQTDGMLLHGFLRYFGSNMLDMPRLANQPAGKGGLVLNWHLDSAEALPALSRLEQMRVWNRGPYSIHITAGPDNIVPGDGLGLDVNNNPVTQQWIRYFISKGHQVGSHGGWIHDYYGINVTEFNQAQFLPYLKMNKQAIEQVTDRAVTEYSAPMGNNPIWALNWLEQNGTNGFYFAGHTGMGQTRVFRDGVLMNPGMWAFPVSTLGKYATFEEFLDYGVSNTDVARWLDALVDFSVNNYTSHLIYFHPPGAVNYPDIMNNLLKRTDAYSSLNKFAWFTMTELAQFMSSRMQVNWNVEELLSGESRFVLSHPTSLSKQAMILSKYNYGKPTITKGKGEIREDADSWVVIAKGSKLLEFTALKLI